MQNFADVKDYFEPAPAGWYLSRIVAAAPHEKKGDGEKFSMIVVTVEIIDQKENAKYVGQQARHYITTDGRAGQAAIFAKQAFRGMGFSDTDFTMSVDDQQLCSALLGRELF